jgi:hypothetical protein
MLYAMAKGFDHCLNAVLAFQQSFGRWIKVTVFVDDSRHFLSSIAESRNSTRTGQMCDILLKVETGQIQRKLLSSLARNEDEPQSHGREFVALTGRQSEKTTGFN